MNEIITNEIKDTSILLPTETAQLIMCETIEIIKISQTILLPVCSMAIEIHYINTY